MTLLPTGYKVAEVKMVDDGQWVDSLTVNILLGETGGKSDHKAVQIQHALPQRRNAFRQALRKYAMEKIPVPPIVLPTTITSKDTEKKIEVEEGEFVE